MIPEFYNIRQWLRWSGLKHQESNCARQTHLLTQKQQELINRYQLNDWFSHCSSQTIFEGLGTLDLLDRVPMEVLQSVKKKSVLGIRAIDIGAKNWRNAGAFSAWLKANFADSHIRLTGIEVDAFRLYRNLRTRSSYGQFYSQKFSTPLLDLQYWPGDVRSWSVPVLLAFWMFPFVSLSPHRAWGLPKNLFDPEQTFAHVESQILPGGSLIMANQGDWELELAKKYIKRLRLRYQECIENSLHASHYPILLTVWTREE